jgi:hypothetical protein
LIIDIKFSGYAVTHLYEKQFQNEKMLEFCIDQQAKMLIILSKIKVTKGKNKIKWLRIIDLQTKMCIYKNEFQKKDVIGRFKLRSFVLSNGHMYFDNTVVKIRYDLIKRVDGPSLRADEIFDVYHNALELDPIESVMLSYPYISMNSHKLIYLTHQKFSEFPSIYKDDDRFISKKMIVLPFLHERKIHVSRFKESHQYFNLIIERPSDAQVICKKSFSTKKLSNARSIRMKRLKSE